MTSHWVSVVGCMAGHWPPSPPPPSWPALPAAPAAPALPADPPAPLLPAFPPLPAAPLLPLWPPLPAAPLLPPLPAEPADPPVALPSGMPPLEPPLPAAPPVDPAVPPEPPLPPPLPPVAPEPPVPPVPPVGEVSSPPQFTSATAAPTTNNVPMVTDAFLIESSSRNVFPRRATGSSGRHDRPACRYRLTNREPLSTPIRSEWQRVLGSRYVSTDTGQTTRGRLSASDLVAGPAEPRMALDDDATE